MSAKTERQRLLNSTDLAKGWMEHFERWGVPEENILWAIQNGARKPNDKRCKTMLAVMQWGASRIVPWDGEWSVRGNAALIEAMDMIEARLRERVVRGG